MLVELAVGDAYGAGFEYAPASFVAARNDLTGYVQHGQHLGIKPGQYTDDTQMTLAVAEALVSGDAWTPLNLASRFVEVFQRDPREGYAGRFYLFLQEVRDGADFLARIRPDSEKSGAAMRSGPIGLLPEVADVMHHSSVQARVTHDTPEGVEAAQAAALAVHYCHYGLGPVAEVGKWIDGQVSRGGWGRVWRGKVGSKGRMSVTAALTALAGNTTMSGLLRDCVAFTGDVDTVATVALAAASRSVEYTQDLPESLVEGLENGPYGREYLAQLNSRLLS
ncbi:ADP-ribosylglycohydrolase family protein [Kibdelosporangium philippinense]|uniref:ADP-ribosylglycohydrolase family protein n=1 Tax=Kibdelosporangium philippinense TaxID=211113 RepID=A0ABS8ZRW1_9PSEU|nr:ADP-ribosylglycohydrolase family protein [Kibdelosporangium philippinense]MCE7010445.1 ADP-ribosylglycohydrolase family protein [Kibdelosporangium philippinense]